MSYYQTALISVFAEITENSFISGLKKFTFGNFGAMCNAIGKGSHRYAL